ncbi:hypothetical protein QQF64_000218 [Cirrhinus molitorella]|uniref:Secreted protein n=1 Tax=Cirrhinus molitorella TaxID=172907 RepID=A0ABR3NWI9_9TELE
MRDALFLTLQFATAEGQRWAVMASSTGGSLIYPTWCTLARPRQRTHNSWPSEDSIGSAQERQSRVTLSEAHRYTAGEEDISTAACRSR